MVRKGGGEQHLTNARDRTRKKHSKYDEHIAHKTRTNSGLKESGEQTMHIEEINNQQERKSKEQLTGLKGKEETRKGKTQINRTSK